MEWMLLPFRRYFDFSGRSRRREFWMFMLLNIIIGCILAGPAYVMLMRQMIAMAASAEAGAPVEPNFGAMILGSPIALGLLGIYGIYALVTIIPSIAVTVRRLHDRNMRGWWYLGVVLLSWIPIIGFLVSIAFLVIMCLDGTPGPNRFGEDPKARGSAEVFS
jgi:uncharacterized membrane protein YhaH (DUF805 family)